MEGTSVTTSVKEVTLFELFRDAAASIETAISRTGEAVTPCDYWLRLPGREIIIVPKNTIIQLWQDPMSAIDTSVSVGTVFMERLQISLLGTGRVKLCDLERRANRALCSLGMMGRHMGRYSARDEGPWD